MRMQSTRNMSLMILILMIHHSHGQVRFNGPDCKTYQSNQFDGSCVPIDRCPFLKQVLTAAQRNDASALSRLRGSVCSQAGSQFSVCCPLRGGFPEKCGGNNGTERIVGGENALLTQWPWMALIRASAGDFQGWVCGGVLISDRYVLTAAHCVVDTNYKIDYVRLGELVLNKNPDRAGSLTAPSPQDINVEKIIGHKQFKKECTRCNDIALLRLVSPARIDNLFVKPICISRNPERDGISERHFTNRKAWVAGWGSTAEHPFIFSQPTNLQQVQLPILDLPFCQQRKSQYTNENMIFCAGDGKLGQDTCRGDSGGPIMVASDAHVWYSIGVVSFGNSICGAKESQAVFTSISYYLPWIEENLL